MKCVYCGRNLHTDPDEDAICLECAVAERKRLAKVEDVGLAVVAITCAVLIATFSAIAWWMQR